MNHPAPYKAYSGNKIQNTGAGGGIYKSADRGYIDVSPVRDNLAIFNKGHAEFTWWDFGYCAIVCVVA